MWLVRKSRLQRNVSERKTCRRDEMCRVLQAAAPKIVANALAEGAAELAGKVCSMDADRRGDIRERDRRRETFAHHARRPVRDRIIDAQNPCSRRKRPDQLRDWVAEVRA